MSNHQPFDGIVPSYQSTLVAVDKDKNSAYAFRWAINHLDNPVIIAAHVTQKNIPNQTMNVLPPDENDVANVFGPLREICTRKVVQIKEAVIDDGDFVKGILEFVNKYYIQSVVVGAAVRNALTSSLRILKVYDAPTMLAKSAPDFCSVYIISKGKVMSVRSAIRNTAFLATPLIQPHTESESGVRAQPARATTHERPRSVASHRESTSDESNAHKLGSLDLSRQDLDFSSTSDNTTSASSVSQPSSRELEAEMKRLRLELQQTMDMYSSACKEAISAKNEAKEIHQWKLEEARRFEEARLAEEAALHMAEMEKAKARAAMEAAEEARKMAEREAQKRMHAEMKARRVAEEKDRALTALVQNDVRYRKYTIEEIETATEKFSQSMKIGEGGYGPVYKGQLDHTPVAIKILRPDAAQGRKQFNQEVEVLSCIRHPNMVLLLGACPEYGCLVYEYMDNGSLEDRLLRKNNSPPIPWWRRFHIAAEIATALLFLHQTKPEPLVHRDLKPANILLDRNYVSKISDVGLARLVPPSVADSVTQYYMTSAAGTFCYIDPEYQQTGMLTTKSDIYSLGIMLLQIITAKPAMGLAHHVKRAIEKEKLSEMLDPVVTDWPLEEALAFAKLSLNCAELSKKDRPDLATVIVPELNRLRDFGWTSQCSAQGYYSSNIQSHSQTGSHARRPPTPTQNPHAKTLHWSQEPMSSGDQESRADLRKGYSS